MFYYFFSATNPTLTDNNIPILIWLNGGPGASSLTGLFYENGLYQLNSNYTVTIRNINWNEKYHMLFIDNPIGTGYSFVDGNNYVTNEDLMGQNFLALINGFYQCHPEYKHSNGSNVL